MKRPAKKPRRPVGPRQKVLIVLLPDGGVEAYAERNLDVHIVNRLDVGVEDAETANLIDDYLLVTIPRCYRPLFWPVNLRATGFHEKVTPEQAADTLFKLSILRGLRAMRESARAVPAAIQRRRATA